MNFADRLGGAVVEAIVGAYRWLEATRLGRALRVTTCAMCGARRRRYNYSMELPNASPDDVAGRLAARDWGAFRYLGRAPTGRMQLLLSFLGCPSCGRDVTLEVLWIQGSWKRVLVKGLDLSEAEVQFLFTIPAVSSYSIERT